jgi:hypothetical protein
MATHFYSSTYLKNRDAKDNIFGAIKRSGIDSWKWISHTFYIISIFLFQKLSI